MRNIYDLTKNELTDYVIEKAEMKYRAKQIFTWLHKDNISDLYYMTNIKKSFIDILKSDFSIKKPKIVKVFKSKTDDTAKYIIKLEDGNIIETVLMEYKYGLTLCISSQVGCAMGCKFCASTLNGVKRNLAVNELLFQIYLVDNDIKKENKKISNIVIMGSGEPLYNLDNILKFFEIINDEDGKNISLRNITLSTCGIVDKIYELAKANLPITLALSLHAPNDKIRKQIMPVADKYNIDETLKAMGDYFIITGRRITFEYILIKGLNDGICNAKELCEKFKKIYYNKKIDFNINLIAVNPIKESNFKRPLKNDIEKFKRILEERNINVTLRRELGSDISGSCGQLRAKFLNKNREYNVNQQ